MSRSLVIARIPQVGGGLRIIKAQDAAHAALGRRLLREDPARVDRLDGVDGIRITVREVQS